MWTLELWAAVIAIGLYHGVNPGMGWPLAVSAGLMERRQAAIFAALVLLAAGHFTAMAVVLLPFAALTAFVAWSEFIRVGAAVLVIGYGLFRIVDRRHPRVLARIRPTQLALWSFTVAIAHGAGLVLVPIYLGLCTPADLHNMGHEAIGELIANSVVMAALVAAVHTLAMIVAGGAMAWAAYRYFGLTFLSKSWFNLDAVWAASLILVGLASILTSL